MELYRVSKGILASLSLLLSSGAIADSIPTQEANWFVNGYVQHEDLSICTDNLGAGLNVGYQYNDAIGAYLGYKKHSSSCLNESPANGVVLGGEYTLPSSVFVFSEVGKYSSHDASVAAGVGYRYNLGDRWSAIAKAGADSDSGAIFNIGVRYDFESKVVKYAGPIVINRVAPPLTPKVITKRFELDVKFEHDSSVILSQYYPQTESLVSILNDNPHMNVTIEGHTSLIGTDSYNKALSMRRAVAVKALMVEAYGINSSRIKTIGYGEERPLMMGMTKEAQRVNRRVVAEISYKEKN